MDEPILNSEILKHIFGRYLRSTDNVSDIDIKCAKWLIHQYEFNKELEKISNYNEKENKKRGK